MRVSEILRVTRRVVTNLDAFLTVCRPMCVIAVGEIVAVWDTKILGTISMDGDSCGTCVACFVKFSIVV